MESLSLKPNKKRIEQRHRDVIRAALRSKVMSDEQLSKASEALINFCLSIIRQRDIQKRECDE